MTGRFWRSDATIETCQKHLDSLSGGGLASQVDPQIEAVLAAYVCSVVYAEAEARVIAIIAARLHRHSSDPYVESYAGIAAKRIVRSIKISELSGFASHFDDECKTRFQASVSSQDQAAWDALMVNRHAVAHESGGAQGLNLTMRDTLQYFASVERVVDAFETCLETPAI